MIRIAKQSPVSGLTAQSKLPGKLVAFQQTFRFLKQHPAKLLTGAGIGNFSSKLAFRATAMNLTGNYPVRFAYINDDFKLNHLDLYAYYFADKDDYHSVVNSPNSTYDQLLSEYGLAGLFSFLIFYIAFFVTKLKRHSVAIPLVMFMLGVFFIEYWFEHLSVVIFFELLLLLNIKETIAIKFETT
jgi:O-antigen ligase